MANQQQNHVLANRDKNMYQLGPYHKSKTSSLPLDFGTGREKEKEDEVEDLVETNKDIIEKIRRIIVMAKRYGI